MWTFGRTVLLAGSLAACGGCAVVWTGPVKAVSVGKHEVWAKGRINADGSVEGEYRRANEEDLLEALRTLAPLVRAAEGAQ